MIWQWLAVTAALLLARALFLALRTVRRRRSSDTARTMIVLGSGRLLRRTVLDVAQSPVE